MTQRKLEELTHDQCIELLRSEAVGRVVFVDESGPAAIPVNYGLAGDEILMRVAATSNLRTLVDAPLGFQVDRTDPEQQSGWSVLARGRGREVPAEDVSALLELLHDAIPRPWAEGVHNSWLAIEITALTGRRLDEPFEAAIF